MIDLFECVMSTCRKYRYTWASPRWSSAPYMQVIGLNPSTADEMKMDPTIRRCKRFAQDAGFGGLVMTNLFAFRATDPRDMKAAAEPIGIDNDYWLKRVAVDAGVVLAAWGTPGSYLDRGRHVHELIPNLHVLRLTKAGHPAHPLYLPAELRPQRWY